MSYYIVQHGITYYAYDLTTDEVIGQAGRIDNLMLLVCYRGYNRLQGVAYETVS